MSSRRRSAPRPASSSDEGSDAGADSDEVMVLFRTSLHNTVFDVFRAQEGWQETRSDTDWDINRAVGWIGIFMTIYASKITRG